MREINIGCIFLAGAMLLNSAFGQMLEPIHTESGDLIGSLKGSVRVFLGVPFAAPPVGPLRWQLPHPVVRNAKPLAADKLGFACMQTLSRSRPPWTEEFMVQNEASEDCLNVNIWAPAEGKAHAVLVFLHGGAFVEGSNGVSSYDGTALARRGLVVVTVNYRLGLFGFFANTDLQRESREHVAGNYAIADQVAALQWVQRNVAAFGGDPARVTLAGQSAGAGSVVALLSSPAAKGLFQRAIVNSEWPAGELATLSAAMAAGDRWSAEHGGGLTALRAMSAEQILAAANDAPDVLLHPVAGGSLVPMQPHAALRMGAGSDVPVLYGWDADDGMIYPDYGTLSAVQFRAEAVKQYGDQSERFLKLYPAPDDATAKRSEKAAIRDRNSAMASIWVEGWKAHRQAPVYLYYFARVPSWPEHPEFGMHHTGELPYFFGTLDKTKSRAYNATDEAVSDSAQQALVRFAETGNPGHPWKPAMGKDDSWAVIDQPMSSQKKLGAAQEAFWREVLQPKN